MKYDYENMIYKSSLSKKEITAFLSHVNRALRPPEASVLIAEMNLLIVKKEGLYLQQKHYETSYKYLIKNHLNKGGRIRKNSPFNDENVEILSDLESIKLLKFYWAGTPFKDFYTPLYEAISSKNKTFKYFVFNNEIQIYNI